MTARAKHRGHPIEWYGNKWIYSEGRQKHAKYGKERPCAHCHGVSESGGPDRCLGSLPGIKAACCGHGEVEEAYFYFKSGASLRGADAVRMRQIWVDNRVSPGDALAIYLALGDLDKTETACKLTNEGYHGAMILDAISIVRGNSTKSLDLFELCGKLEI